VWKSPFDPYTRLQAQGTDPILTSGIPNSPALGRWRIETPAGGTGVSGNPKC
jgi:hypothetical protein